MPYGGYHLSMDEMQDRMDQFRLLMQQKVFCRWCSLTLLLLIQYRRWHDFGWSLDEGSYLRCWRQVLDWCLLIRVNYLVSSKQKVVLSSINLFGIQGFENVILKMKRGTYLLRLHERHGRKSNSTLSHFIILFQGKHSKFQDHLLFHSLSINN